MPTFMQIMDRENRKFNLFWKLGTIFSFIVYYSGILAFYQFIVKTVLKKHHGVILTYHQIHDGSEDAHMSVKPETFQKQIIFLRERFRIVPLDCIEESHRYLKKRDCCMITFDDGYRDNYLNAYPFLKKYHIPATIFIVTGNVGKSLKWVSKGEMKEMTADGMVFGSHTISHPLLADLTLQQASHEIIASKMQLEAMLEEKVNYFAYPRGKKKNFSEAIKAVVRESGYKAAVTMENGVLGQEKDLYELKRIGVRECPFYVFKVRVSGFFENPFIMWIRKLVNI